MKQEKREKINSVLWMISPLHKEQVEKLNGFTQDLKERFGLLPKQYKRYIAGGVSLLLALGSFYAFSNADRAFAIEINGKKIALVEDVKKAQVDLQQVVSEKNKELGQKVDFDNHIEYVKTKAKNINLDSSIALKRKLRNSLTFVTTGTAIVANGEEKAVLLNKKTAEKALNELAKTYVAGYRNAEIVKVEYVDNVEFVNRKIDVTKVLKENVVVEKLKQSKQKVVTYTVANGESVWTIARKNDMYVSQIQEANPGLNVDKLKLGQVLNLNKSEPVLRLKVYAKGTVTETVAYDVKVESDAGMYSGQEKVKQQGEAGSKETTYDLVINSGVLENKNVIVQNVTKQPKTKVVTKGTKYMVASRGDGGSGQLAWPISGPIFSGYGPRRGEFHPGIDIGAGTGTPIGAAEAGTVTFAGWYYGYGNFVIIDHGNGLVTRYGHLSRFNSSAGMAVTRGQIIGYVGSTGRSTAPHLHFEVLVGGSTRNPIGYLR